MVITQPKKEGQKFTTIRISIDSYNKILKLALPNENMYNVIDRLITEYSDIREYKKSIEGANY